MIISIITTVLLLAIAGHYAHKAEVLKKGRAQLREAWYNPKPSREELRCSKVSRVLIAASIGSFLLLVLLAIGGLPLALIALAFLVLMHTTLAAA